MFLPALDISVRIKHVLTSSETIEAPKSPSGRSSRTDLINVIESHLISSRSCDSRHQNA